MQITAEEKLQDLNSLNVKQAMYSLQWILT